jgi:hypothetical protein
MALTTTTLAVAITTTKENFINVTSAVGFHVGDLLRIDQEAMTVLGIEGLVIRVMRGVCGTIAMAHPVAVNAVCGPSNEAIFPVGFIPTGSDIATAAGETVGSVTVLLDGALSYIPVANHHH